MILPKKAMLLFLMVLVFCGVTKGEVYKVGDSTGWTDIGHFDYKSWSASKNFRVGDSIVFEYNKQFHNVVRVTHKNFDACNAATTYSTFNTGNDTFVIRRPGHFYFICSFPGHCQNGQKVDIRVPKPTKSSSSPSSSPSSKPNSPLEPVTPSATWAPSPSPAADDKKSGSSELFFSFKLWLSMLLIVASMV
ncbi:mavicyanin-like [Nicotiana tabacum]|uniref:Mavicyanin-like n=2 Tax=Nicotiana TaxID=4085 RepID=A0A1S3ZQA6_TOBAC|nr:PREDICTED: mavicyanin-like [Nicotiana sylvestris]XP_016466484.1 PREDICTED: mavicyanin-like [Nicotiana tabacum]